MLRTLFPAGSFRRRLAKKVLYKFGFARFAGKDFYQTWAEQNHLNIPLYPVSGELKRQPLISIIIPAYNTPKRYLVPLIDSIVGQTYENWELVLVNGATNPIDKAVAEKCAAVDSRITLVDFPNKGIARNTNEGIQAATGDYIAFADHDDLLDRSALLEVVKALNEHPQAGLFYTDEDKVSEEGERYFDPHFKPGWSPDLLTNVNYINHFVVVKKALAVQVGMLNPERDGAQDYDFLLKVVDTGTEVVHIPKILYHWRIAENSTAADFSNKPRITEAGKKSLEDHFARVKEQATVTVMPQRPGFYKVTYAPQKDVSLIIPPFANARLLSLYTELLLRRTNSKGLHLIAGEDVNVADAHADSVKVTKIRATNYEEFLRQAVKKAKSSVVCMNQILLPLDPEWIHDMSGLLGPKRIAAAAPLIVNNEREIEDCGLVGDPLAPLFSCCKMSDATYFGNTEWTRDVDALSGACIFVRKHDLQVFLDSYKGMDGDIFTAFTRQQFHQQRYNVIWPHVLMNNASFRLANPRHRSNFYNPSLFTKKGTIHLYSTEEQVIEYLIFLKKEWYHEQL